MNRLLPSLLATAASLVGCGSVQISPVVKPQTDFDGPEDLSDRALEDVDALHDRIDGNTDGIEALALSRLLETYVGLGTIPDDIARAEGRTVLTAGRPPLQHFPRLTFPAILEPERVADGRSAWLIPVILNRTSFFWTPGRGNVAPEGRFGLFHGGSELFRVKRLLGFLAAEEQAGERDLTFWLERHAVDAEPDARRAAP